MDPFNPAKLALPPNVKREWKNKNSPPRHRIGEKFLKGPTPWNWLTIAAKLPGKALHVAIAIWFLAGVNRSSTINLSVSVLRQMGVARNAYYRGLELLEKAELISVARHRGRLPEVIILERNEHKERI